MEAAPVQRLPVAAPRFEGAQKKRHQGRFLVSFQNLENSVMVEAATIT